MIGCLIDLNVNRPEMRVQMMSAKVETEFISYNRAAAVAYARAYWSLACSDGYVAIKQPPYFKKVDAATKFLRTTASDPKTEIARPGSGSDIPLDHLEDCTPVSYTHLRAHET